MEWLNFLETVWTAMNSPIGITITAGILAWLLERVYLARPAWKAYEGTIIAAIKYAEKEIPDGASNTAIERLNMALQYVLKVYARTEGRMPSGKVEAELAQAIGVKHAELEAGGNLRSKTGPEVKHD